MRYQRHQELYGCWKSWRMVTEGVVKSGRVTLGSVEGTVGLTV